MIVVEKSASRSSGMKTHRESKVESYNDKSHTTAKYNIHKRPHSNTRSVTADPFAAILIERRKIVSSYYGSAEFVIQIGALITAVLPTSRLLTLCATMELGHKCYKYPNAP
jgi:hypothetical protein